MYTPDDPLLTLIYRFVGAEKRPGISDQEFLLEQVEAVRSYVMGFPEQGREDRALEWVERFAEQYREHWQRKHLLRWMRDLRCPDCPLAERGAMRHCRIHDDWSDILTQYAAKTISSREYVERSLSLLRKNKEQLKQLRSCARSGDH